MEKLRTPDDRFAGLPDWPYAPHYMEVDDCDGGQLRIHYVDEGPRDAKPVVLFHGEPTWAYLYRKMIPHLLKAGHRVLAPDLVGMGRSDKPTLQSDYSFERHVGWMRAWVRALDVQRATWFGQDWGSLIGLGVVTQEPSRFEVLVLANGILIDPDNMGRLFEFAMKAPDPMAFQRWQAWIKDRSEIDAGLIIGDGIPGADLKAGLQLSAAERAAYNAPFPDPRYQACALVFPFLGVDMSAEGKRICTEGWKVLEKWEKPLVTAYGKADPVLGWADAIFHKWVPGAKGQPHRTFPNGTHFIQEEEPEALSAVITEVMARGQAMA